MALDPQEAIAAGLVDFSALEEALLGRMDDEDFWLLNACRAAEVERRERQWAAAERLLHLLPGDEDADWQAYAETDPVRWRGIVRALLELGWYSDLPDPV